MHQRKLVAKPRKQLTTKQKLKSKHHDLCKCGKPKRKDSLICWDCHHPKSPDYFWKGRTKCDFCPMCNGPKYSKSKLCAECRLKASRPNVSKKIVYVEGEPCRQIPLTKKKIAIVDACRYREFAAYNWQSRYRKRENTYYAVRSEYTNGKKKDVYMHHQALGWYGQIDHKNNNGWDNRVSNLRKCTYRQNAQHRRVLSHSRSGYKGAFLLTTPRKNGKKYVSRISVKGKYIYLGTFYEAEEAARAYDRASIKYSGEFAWLNFPRSDYIDD